MTLLVLWWSSFALFIVVGLKQKNTSLAWTPVLKRLFSLGMVFGLLFITMSAVKTYLLTAQIQIYPITDFFWNKDTKKENLEPKTLSFLDKPKN